MGVRLTSEENVTALYDSVTGWAFGTVFATPELAEDFLIWLAEEPRGRPEIRVLAAFRNPFAWADPRCYTNNDLERLIGLWREERVDFETGFLREEITA